MDIHYTSDDVNSPNEIILLFQSISKKVKKIVHNYLSQNHGLSLPQYQLLLAVTQKGESTLGDLADEVDCSRSNLTKIVDYLENCGWLVRERDVEDRRIIRVKLTSKGLGVKTIQDDVLKEISKLANAWSNEEISEMRTNLIKIHDHLKSVKVENE